MFEQAQMLYIYVETPLHAGSGRGIGGIDLPIQRERITDYPMVQASSLKGRLRAEAEAKLDHATFLSIFGQAEDTGAFGGAISPGDARLLLFPVRSLAGVFAWATSPLILRRFVRDATMVGLQLDPIWQQLPSSAAQAASQVRQPPAQGAAVPAPQPAPAHAAATAPQPSGAVAPTPPPTVNEKQALVAPTSHLKVGTSGSILLEEYDFTARSVQRTDKTEDLVTALAQEIAQLAFPSTPEYTAWSKALPQQLVILHDTVFRDFVRLSTELATRVRLDAATKTVIGGALWVEESLPSETVLYAPLYATATRSINGSNNQRTGAPLNIAAKDVLDTLTQLGLNRIRLGGDETVGRGSVYLRWGAVATPNATTPNVTTPAEKEQAHAPHD
ncbi:MAG: type III-B CRISPR module RAMP protein Cmr4 [Chloroflexota bacterium]|nr:type III-B CRISPR module RAMP protein Cmr4 [Chloroflexota bacterium]